MFLLSCRKILTHWLIWMTSVQQFKTTDKKLQQLPRFNLTKNVVMEKDLCAFFPLPPLLRLFPIAFLCTTRKTKWKNEVEQRKTNFFSFSLVKIYLNGDDWIQISQLSIPWNTHLLYRWFLGKNCLSIFQWQLSHWSILFRCHL